MQISIKDKKPGIYVIENIVNNKKYVGKSKNVYKRIHQHVSDILILERNYNENPHLLNSVNHYGLNNFKYYIVEEIVQDENLEENLKIRELYWMKKLNTLDREFGYNLRYDSEGKCFCSQETKDKVSKRAKKDWENGSHKDHSKKLKEYWNDNTARKESQSKLLSELKQKYVYDIYLDDKLLYENADYSILTKLSLKNCISTFGKKQTNDIIFKNHRIIRKNK